MNKQIQSFNWIVYHLSLGLAAAITAKEYFPWWFKLIGLMMFATLFLTATFWPKKIFMSGTKKGQPPKES